MEVIQTKKTTCIKMFIALFIMAKDSHERKRNQSKCPTVEK